MKDHLVGRAVTLDGKPAIIAGRLNPFATIAALDGSAAYEWAWGTATRIADAGGDFRS